MDGDYIFYLLLLRKKEISHCLLCTKARSIALQDRPASGHNVCPCLVF